MLIKWINTGIATTPSVGRPKVQNRAGWRKEGMVVASGQWLVASGQWLVDSGSIMRSPLSHSSIRDLSMLTVTDH